MAAGRDPPHPERAQGGKGGVKDYARRRLEKASESIEAARLLLTEGFQDSAADRSYYAMFYAVEALLADRDLDFSSHGAVHGAFGRLFAKTGELDPKYHGWLIRAFEARQSATYGVDLNGEADAASIGALIEQAEEFVSAIRRYLALEA
jgi:uncharacterized protein (UPF0332 family)